MKTKKYKKIIIHKVKDTAEKYYTKKAQLFDLPAKVAVVGASQRSGKTNWIINALGKPNMYSKDFKSEDIYIFSPSLKSNKWVRFIKADEQELSVIYDDIKEQYNEAVSDNKRPPNVVIIFDDLGFGGSLRGKSKHGILDALVLNGRHYNLSTFFLVQSYKQLAPDVRGNLSGLVVFNLSTRELDQIVYEHNYLENSRDFMKLFRRTTKVKHSYFVINYSNDTQDIYMDSNFRPVRLLEDK